MPLQRPYFSRRRAPELLLPFPNKMVSNDAEEERTWGEIKNPTK